MGAERDIWAGDQSSTCNPEKKGGQPAKQMAGYGLGSSYKLGTQCSVVTQGLV